MTQDKDLRELAIATDTELARLYGERNVVTMEIDRLATRRANILNPKYGYYTTADLRKTETDLSEALYKKATIAKAMQPLEAIFNEHKWTRAFLVVSSTGGHVHRSMNCATCFPTTTFVWLPNYSGTDENLIVEDAGERACTVCYPSAPVSILSRPSRIFSDDERAAQKAREERAAAKAEREAKRAAKAPCKDGKPLPITEVHVGYDGKQHTYRRTLNTEVAATSEYLRMATSLDYIKNPVERDSIAANMLLIEQALAFKHGVTVEQQRAVLAAKVAKKRKQEARP